jgi:hypothetical protein
MLKEKGGHFFCCLHQVNFLIIFFFWNPSPSQSHLNTPVTVGYFLVSLDAVWENTWGLFVSDDNILKVTDEWKLLSMDQSRHSLSYKRVDHFWREVFSQTASNDTISFLLTRNISLSCS